MNEMVQSVIAENICDQAGRDINWEIHPLAKASGDPTLINQVWINLIANALKYTTGKAPAEIEIGSEESVEALSFFIRDNGAGFDMKHRDKLFGAFQRLHHDDEFSGTGVGLAHSLRIVTRHGGTMWAEGKVGQGATFSFSLPRHPAS